jgi:hypothetical protein
LGYATCTVRFSSAGEDEWVQAMINRPLVTGDRLWADTGARTELQIGAAVVRMGSATSLTLLNLDDRVAQLQLAQGSLNVRVRRLGANEVFEIDTPNVAFSIRRPGEYRIDVDAAGSATIVAVRSGQADVYGEGASYVVNARQAYRFAGTGLRDYERFDTLPLDEFDRWAAERDRRWDTSVSARYVSPEVIGYQDLDSYGAWRVVPDYGNVWVPSRVSADWAPYRDGHWTWVDPWGWTWVDDEPWGFAVSHYGRWANLSGSWGWVPGPIAARAVYAPALVAFVGGNNFQIGGTGGVGWFPLAPREIYRPAYSASRRYFNDVNASNTVINNTVINNVYNNPNATNATYVNRRIPGAIVAVPTTAFVQAQPVSRAAVRVSPEMIANAPVTPVAAVAPMRASVTGPAKPAGKPPAAILERPVVARTAPPPRPVGFAPREQLLAKNPGRPLDTAAVSNLASPAAPPPGKIQLITPSQTRAPTSAPPMRAQADKPGKAEQRFQPPSQAAQPPVSQPPTAAQPPVVVAPGKMASPSPQPIVPGGLRARPVVPDSQSRAGRDAALSGPNTAARSNATVPPPPMPPVTAPHEPRGKPERPSVPASPPAAAPPVAAPAPAPRPEVGKVERRARPPASPAAPAAMAPAPAAAPPEPPHGKPERQPRREVQAPPAAQPPASAPPPPQARPAPPPQQQARPAPPPQQQARPAPPPQQQARPAPPPQQQARPGPPPQQQAPTPPAARPPAASAPPPQPQAQPRGPQPKPEDKPHEEKGGDEKPKK